jgi:hypothetical protein
VLSKASEGDCRRRSACGAESTPAWPLCPCLGALPALGGVEKKSEQTELKVSACGDGAVLAEAVSDRFDDACVSLNGGRFGLVEPFNRTLDRGKRRLWVEGLTEW